MDLYTSFIVYLILYRISIAFIGFASIYFGYKLFLNGVFGVQEGSGKGTDFQSNFGGNKLILKNAAPGTLFALFGVILISFMIINGSPELTQESLNDFNQKALNNGQITNEENFKTQDSTISSNDSPSSLQVLRADITNEKSIEDFSLEIAELKEETQREIFRLRQRVTLRGDDEDMELINGVIDERIKAMLYDGGAITYLFNEKEYSKVLNIIAMNINAVAWDNKIDGKPEKALEQAKLAVALNPDEANFLDTIAEIYADLGDYKNAVLYMKRAAQVDPNKESRLRELNSILDLQE